MKGILQNVFAAIPNIERYGIRVLCYHLIGNYHPFISLKKSTFEAHINYITSQGYRFISLDELLSILEKKTKADKAILLTFDDAYANFNEIAGFLSDRNLPSVLSVPGALLDGYLPPDLKQYASLMTRADLERLSRNPYVTLLPHGYSHIDLTSLTHQRMQREIEIVLDKVSQLTGFAPKAFVYPFGAVNCNIKNVLEQQGIKYAFSIKNAAVKVESEKLFIPRFCINSYTADSYFKLILSPNITNYMKVKQLLSRSMSWQEGHSSDQRA